MAPRTMIQHGTGSRNRLQTAGLVALLVGALGVAAWALMASFGASYGSVAADTLAGEIAQSGVEDPVDAPELWTAKDMRGRVVFEGTREELDAVWAEGEAAYQAELRTTWLYGPAAITVLGVVLLGVGARRRGSMGTPR